MFEKVILKSVHPEEYPDLEIVCRVIQNDEIGAYIESIPEERKLYAHKSASVKARVGKPGETIKTTLVTVVDGKEYIIKEENFTVKERPEKDQSGKEVMVSDMVVTNFNSTSNEEYVVKYKKFATTYVPEAKPDVFTPVYDSRLLSQVDENVIIITAWGEPAICLAGSYIVTYSAEENDYNAIEKDAFKSTYTVDGAARTLTLYKYE